MVSALLEQILSSEMALLAYASMAVLVAETGLMCLRAEIWLARSRSYLKALRRDLLLADDVADLKVWLRSNVRRTSWSIDLIVQLAPVMGIGWTMASFAAATFGMDEALASDPGQVFNLLGVGAGTSLFGAICLGVSLIQANRLMLIDDLLETANSPDDTAGAAVEISAQRSVAP